MRPGTDNDIPARTDTDAARRADHDPRRADHDTPRADHLTPRADDDGRRADDDTRRADADRLSATDPASVRARQKEAFGGMKFGSAFFGWLTTVGATVVLIAFGTAIATGINADNELSNQDLRNVGIGAAIALLVILFISYFAGGYVAGRMARFNGVRQGLAVWLWAVIFAIILTIVGVVAGNQTDLAAQANLPDIPADAGDVTAAGLIALAVVLVVTLIAAMLGGLAGMRFHRRVDRAGFDTSLDTDAGR